MSGMNDRRLGGCGTVNRRSHTPERSPGLTRHAPLDIHAESEAPGRVLVPVDISACALEAFSFVNRFDVNERVTVTCLHVIDLNIILFENHLIDDLYCEAEKRLKGLCHQLLKPNLTVRLRVRVGRPAREILAEAKESNTDLIVLTSLSGCSFWKQLLHPKIVEKVVRAAPCDVVVLRVQTRFNVESGWTRAKNFASGLH